MIKYLDILLPAIVIRYIKKNWGAPFIAVSLALLFVAAICSSLGWFSFADTVSIYTFYTLVIGVVLQLICFLKYRETEETKVRN